MQAHCTGPALAAMLHAMGIQVSGRLHAIFETKQVTDRFQKREFVLELSDKSQYSQFVLFQLTGDRVGAVDAFKYAITSPVEFAPGTVGRYRNSDPMALGFLVQQAVRKRGDEYLTFPQRALFDAIGIRRQVLEPDPWGNFLLSGYDYGTARNWARLGLLYLRDGVWQGKRLLPEGWATFVGTPAPAWRRPEYGGMFWVNGI